MTDQGGFFFIVTWCQLIYGEKIDEMSKSKFVRGCIFHPCLVYLGTIFKCHLVKLYEPLNLSTMVTNENAIIR